MDNAHTMGNQKATAPDPRLYDDNLSRRALLRICCGPQDQLCAWDLSHNNGIYATGRQLFEKPSRLDTKWILGSQNNCLAGLDRAFIPDSGCVLHGLVELHIIHWRYTLPPLRIDPPCRSRTYLGRILS